MLADEESADHPMVVYGMSDLLTCDDGSTRTREEAIAELGHVIVRQAELNDAVREHLEKPMPLTAPRRIFLSYKWGSAEDNQWVADFAADLRSLGNVVVFDQDELLDSESPDVASFVAKIASCHLFVAIIDPGYLNSIPHGDQTQFRGTWVFDEFDTANKLMRGGRMGAYAVLRKGDTLPDGYSMITLRQAGNAVDARTANRRNEALDLFFRPKFPIPRPEVASAAEQLIFTSAKLLDEGRLDAARELATEAIKLIPDLSDGYAQLARVELQSGRGPALYEAAKRAMEIYPDLAVHDLWAALGARQCNKLHEAISIALKLIEARALHADARALLADCLDEMEQVYPSVAHYELARKEKNSSFLHNDTGAVYRRSGQLDKAIRCFAKAAELVPTDTRVLVNLSGSLAENGQLDDAEAVATRIRPATGAPPVGEFLKEIISEARLSDSPVVIVRPIERPETLFERLCTRCRALIPVVSSGHNLCVRCGAEFFVRVPKCKCCGSRAFVDLAVFAPDGIPCPYCRVGKLRTG
jgi:tetratricopeptide (TPR) repeat protein